MIFFNKNKKKRKSRHILMKMDRTLKKIQRFKI